MSNTKIWYKKNDNGKTLYSPFNRTKRTPVVIHPHRTPTPDEIVGFLSENLENKKLDDTGDFGWIFEESNDGCVELPPGMYKYQAGSYGEPEGLIPLDIRKDSYTQIDKHFEDIVEDMKQFYMDENLYNEMGAIYNRKYLLYGPPGNGKTSLIRNILQNHLPENSIIIYSNSVPSTHINKILNTNMKNVWKIFVFEEFATLFQYESADKILEYLDGSETITKAITFATTNYPDMIPGNVIDRPSRFDEIYEVGNPTTEIREKILTHYFKRKPTSEEISATADLSTASIKEAVLLSRRGRMEFMDAIEKMKTRSKLVKKAFAKPTRMGLNVD